MAAHLRLRGDNRFRARAYDAGADTARDPLRDSTDAHSTADLQNLPFGIAMARKGGVRRGEILNALPAAPFVAAVRPAGN